jgi:hypothetical protein
VQHLLKGLDLFTRDDAFVVLGIGKYMVRSIERWYITLGAVKRVDHRGPQGNSPGPASRQRKIHHRFIVAC